MKKFLLPIIVLATGLILFALGYFHSSNTISRQSAEQIATDYIVEHSEYYDQEKYEIHITNLDTDLFTTIIGNQKWRVYIAWPQGILTINAYSGKVEDVEYCFYEWVTQSNNEMILLDFLPVIAYALLVLFSFLFTKNSLMRVLLWVSVGLFLLSFPLGYVISGIWRLFIAA